MELDGTKEFEELLERSTTSFNNERAQNPIKEISTIVKTLPAFSLLSEWINHSESDLSAAPMSSGNLESTVTDIQGLVSNVTECRNDLLFDICSSTVSAEYLALQLSNLIPKPGEPFDIDAIEKVINIVNNLNCQKKIKKSDVARTLIKHVQLIPLTILLRLLDSNILCLEDYLKRLQTFGSLEDYIFNQIIGHFRGSGESSQIKADWSADDDRVLTFLASLASVGSTADEATAVLQEKLNGTINNIFYRHDFYNLYRNEKQHRFLITRLSEIDEIGNKASLASRLLRRFICQREQTSVEDRYNKTSGVDAYNNHTDWLFGKLNQNAVSVIQSLLLSLDDEEIADILCLALRGTDCNFQALLSISSVWLYSSEASIPLVTNMLEKVIRESIEIRNTWLLKNALLLARHCSLEGLAGFPSYADWLKGLMTQLETLLLEDREGLATYVKCLSMILPIEKRDFLKTHLNTLPQVTSTAKQLINEYVIVAKTKLNDLKDSPLSNGSSRAFPDHLTDFALKDVKRNLSQYSSTSVLPKSLLEMSVFRKSYFVGQFLPAVLNPETVRADEIRRRFVEELKNAGKIPKKMYNAFQQALETETLTDTFANADSNFDEFIERIINKIEDLPQATSNASGIEEPKKRRLVIQSYISSLSMYLSKLQEARERYDINSTERALFESKIINCLLDKICHGFAVSLGASNCKWVKSVIRMLSEHGGLFAILKLRIVELLASNLEDYHLQALACIAASYEGIRTSSGYSSIIKDVTMGITDTTAEGKSPTSIQQSLLVVSYMLLFCSELYSDVIVIEDVMIHDVAVVVNTVLVPRSVVKLWAVMLHRLRITNLLIKQSCEFVITDEKVSALSRISAIAEALKDQRVFSAVVNDDKLDLAEWIHFEIGNSSRDDIMPHLMKQEYYLKVINDHQKVEHLSQLWSNENVSTTIVHSMLSYSNVGKIPIGATCKGHENGTISKDVSGTSRKLLSENAAEDGNTSGTRNRDNGMIPGTNRANLSTSVSQDSISRADRVNGARFVTNKATTEQCGISLHNILQEAKENSARKIGSGPAVRQANWELLPVGCNSDLLFLLRSLNEEIISKCEEVEDDLFADNSSWLLNAFKSWIQRQDETDNTDEQNRGISNINPRQLTHALCAIIDSLPKSLLFTNDVSSQSSYDSLLHVSTFVNQLSSHVLNNSFYLPCSLTIRLLDALSSYCVKPNTLLQDEGMNEANSNMQHFLSSSLIFCVSLVQYYDSSPISRRIQTLIDNGVCSLHNISSMHSALQSLNYKGLTDLDSSSTVLGVCLFNSWWSQSSEKKSDLLTEIVTIGEGVTRVFFECFILKLTTCLFQGKGHSSSVNTRELFLQAVRVLKMIPNVVIALIDEIMERASYSGLRNLRYNLIGKSTLRLFPVVVVKVIAAMDPLYLKRFSSVVNSSEVIRKCVRRSESLLTEARADWPKEVTFSPLDVSFVKELGIVRKILQI